MKKLIALLIISFSIFAVGCNNINNKGDNSGLGDEGKLGETQGTGALKEAQDEGKGDLKEDENKDKTPTENEEASSNTIYEEISSYTIKDLIGIKANEKYSYEGINNEYAEYVRYVDYIEGNKFQIRTNNSGTETVKVIEATDEELRVVFKRNECYYRENFLKKPVLKSEVLLKMPLAVGNQWTLEDGGKRYISSIDKLVETPLGQYECIEVTTENKNGMKDLAYYAPEVGLVKEVFDVGGMEATSTLKTIEKDARLNQVIRFYYPDNEANFMEYKDVEIAFATNDITKVILQNKFRSIPGGNRVMLKENVAINTLYLNDDGMVYLDLTKNFISEMANGTTGEYFAIQDLVNTLGGYYGVNKVYISLDGEKYSSGHILKDKWECFNVDLSKVK